MTNTLTLVRGGSYEPFLRWLQVLVKSFTQRLNETEALLPSQCSLGRSDEVLGAVLRSVLLCLQQVLALWPQLSSWSDQSSCASGLASHASHFLLRLLRFAASPQVASHASDGCLLLATSAALLCHRNCPPCMLHSGPLRAALVTAFAAVWDAEDGAEGAVVQRRRLQCVQALRRLAAHPEPAVAAFCVRAILPQVSFRFRAGLRGF